MANHKDALKRVRQAEKRRLHNRYYAKNMRNEVRKFRALTDKSVLSLLTTPLAQKASSSPTP